MKENENFIKYRENLYLKWQRTILLTSLLAACVILFIEIFTYITFITNGLRPENDLYYILIRIVIPSSLNFGVLFAASLVTKNKKINCRVKNIMVSYAIFTICSVVSIFHNYFCVLLAAPSFAFFICSIFGDTKILNMLALSEIPLLIISLLVFCFVELELIFKVLNMLCSIVFIVFSFAFSHTFVTTHANLLEYIHKNYRLQTDLIQELNIDSLTKLYNKKAMDNAIGRIIHKAIYEDIKPYLVILDIDFFKKINDRFGYSMGDRVLMTISEIIKDKMGGARQAFRYGGEEFVLLFEDTLQFPVISLVEEIQNEFSNYKFDFDSEASYTISAGISALEPGWDSKKWFRTADESLYYAKTHGRNQIKIYEKTY